MDVHRYVAATFICAADADAFVAVGKAAKPTMQVGGIRVQASVLRRKNLPPAIERHGQALHVWCMLCSRPSLQRARSASRCTGSGAPSLARTSSRNTPVPTSCAGWRLCDGRIPARASCSRGQRPTSAPRDDEECPGAAGVAVGGVAAQPTVGAAEMVPRRVSVGGMCMRVGGRASGVAASRGLDMRGVAARGTDCAD